MFPTLRGNKNTGFVLLEVLVSIALIAIVFIALLGIAPLAVNVSTSIQKETQADALVKEEFEATRDFRDGTKWTTTGLGTASTGSANPYHVVNNAGQWTLVAGTETSGIFTRKIVFDRVSRDPGTQNIEAAYNGSHDDSDTRKITVTVTWSGGSIQDVEYLTNWQS